MNLTDNIKAQIKEHALAELPKECCGYVLDNGEVIKAKNISENPKERFEIDLKSYLKAEGKSKICYHSHDDNGDFSDYDKLISEGHKIPMLMYCIKNDTFNIYNPKGYINNYTGRAFKIGQQDCLSLIRNYYEKELNIQLKDYPRNQEWLENPANDYEINYTKEGFSKVDSFKKHDMILFKFPNQKFASHAGVYLGNDSFLHHLRDSISNIEKYSGVYKRITFACLRHELLK